MNWLFLPPWRLRILVPAAGLLVALLVARALRERRTVRVRRQATGLLMRTLVILTLVCIALNPTFLRPRQIEGRPVMTVLIDTSYSMATRDVEGKSRLGAALEVLNDPRVRSRLEESFVLDVRRFDRDVTAADASALTDESARGRASDVAAAVCEAVDDLGDRKGQAGVLLISDGRATTAGTVEAGRLALARSVPLWSCCLGGEVPRRDLWIDVPNSELLAFSQAEVELAATLHQVGYPHRAFSVEVLHGANVLRRLDVTPGPNGEAAVKVKVKAPKQGEERYVFRAVEEEDEAEGENNERSVFVRAVGEKVRVLVVEGEPHWDTKFLVQCLKRNPRVDVTAVYRLGQERQLTVISTRETARRESKDLFPRTPEAFSRYDVIIMGRGCEAFFDDRTEEYLTAFVSRRGGGLVFSRGKPYGGRFQALSKFEPVVWGTGVVQGVRIVPVTAAGAGPVSELSSPDDLDALLTRLPPFDQILHTVGVKPLAVVLADGHTGRDAIDMSAVIMAYHLYGQGRVVTVNASGLWRWSFRDKEKPEDEFVYDHFWSGLLRWILSGSDFLAGHDTALRADRRLYSDEQPVQFLVRTRGLDQEAYRPRLTIRGSGTATEVEPRRQTGGTYLAQAGPFPTGTYEVDLVNNIGRPPRLSTTIEVVSASIENRVLSANPELMRRLAEVSEGRTVSTEDLPHMGRIVREWQARKRLAEEKQSMWDRWWLLTTVLLVLGVEWFVRRREGLL